MFKSLALFTICFLLVASILAPAIITLADCNSNTALVVDFGEEEKEQGKKNFEKEDILFYHSYTAAHLLSIERANAISLYFSSYSDYVQEIQLPPPERFV